MNEKKLNLPQENTKELPKKRERNELLGSDGK